MNKMSFKFTIALSFLLISACRKNNINNTNENAGNVNAGRIALSDFGSATYRGFRGGLYPNGANQRPTEHNAAGVTIAQTIKPLNSSGTVDETNGKIVWMSIGMSNTTQETQAFLTLLQTFQNKNPALALVDGAAGGQDINAINNPGASYWNLVNNKLVNAGLTAAQVQVIWFKEAEARPTDTSFLTYPDALKNKFRSVMGLLKVKFPNLKICYLSNRIYAGYATTDLNPEPFAWYSGWSVKRLIEDQIAGDASLRYTGTNPSAAWLSWGPDLWANGTMARSDGVVWVASDYQQDGTHPATSGRQKVAQMLLQFFSTDETTKPWFLKP